MPVTMQSFQLVLAAILPLLLPFLGSSVAYLLRQNGFDHYIPWLNPLIAWSLLLVTAAVSAFASGTLSGNDPLSWIGAIAAAVSLLAAGALHSWTPWLVWLDFVQSHLFAVVKTPPAPVVAGGGNPTVFYQPASSTTPPYYTPTASSNATSYAVTPMPTVMSYPNATLTQTTLTPSVVASEPLAHIPVSETSTPVVARDLTWINITYPMAALNQQAPEQGK